MHGSIELMSAERAKLITWVVTNKLKSKDDAIRQDAIETINALMIPRGYVYYEDNLVHLVMINESSEFYWPRSLTYAADVIWHVNTVTSTWVVRKDRTSIYERLVPIMASGCVGSIPKI